MIFILPLRTTNATAGHKAIQALQKFSHNIWFDDPSALGTSTALTGCSMSGKSFVLNYTFIFTVQGRIRITFWASFTAASIKK